MEDFDKVIKEVFGDRYKEIESSIKDSKVLPTESNIQTLSKLALLSSDIMDLVDKVTICNYSDLSKNIQKLDEQVKLYKKIIFHTKLDKK